MGIVSLQGRITVSNANEMRRTLADALRLQPKEVTVDLSSVNYMDTSGLSTLMEAKRNARRPTIYQSAGIGGGVALAVPQG